MTTATGPGRVGPLMSTSPEEVGLSSNTRMRAVERESSCGDNHRRLALLRALFAVTDACLPRGVASRKLQPHRMLAAARTVVGFGLILQAAGFGKLLVIANYFGAGPLLDAYYLGLVVP